MSRMRGNRRMRWLALAGVLSLMLGNSAVAQFAQCPAPDYEIVIEAEDFDAKVAGSSGPGVGVEWEVATSPPAGFSGSGVMITDSAAPNLGDNPADFEGGPRMDYTVNFTQAGTHYVHVRAYEPSGGEDSVHYGLNGTPGAARIGYDTDPTTYGWWDEDLRDPPTRATIDVPSPGEHTFSIWMRDSGSPVDKIVITTTESGFDPETAVACAAGEGEGEGEGEGRVMDGLVGWWRFEEDSGTTIADSSGNGHDGTPVVFGSGTPVNLDVIGQLGGAVEIPRPPDEASVSFIEVPSHPDFDITGDLSIEFWIKPDEALATGTPTSTPTVLARGDRTYQLRMFGSGRFRVNLRNADADPEMNAELESSAGNLTADEWTHVVFVADGTERLFYIDGVLDAGAQEQNTEITGPIATPDITAATEDDTLQIGGQYSPDGTPRRALGAQLDEVALYNRALSEAEIQQNMNADPDAGGPPPEQGNEIISNVYPPFIDAGTVVILTAPDGSDWQWAKDDADITGATDRELVFDPVKASDEGSYTVTYDDGAKVIRTSPPFLLTVEPEGTVPAAGLLGLAALAGACALGGASVLRRRK